MIWVGGRVVPDEALKVSVLDRTFEHGLGLFETLRTWNGRAPLLDRHLARMARSARELGLPYDSVMPPDDNAVSDLINSQGTGGDVMLRLTLTGGRDETAGALLWMRAASLPPPLRRDGAVIDMGTWWVNPDDTFLRYKSLNYWARRRAFESASRLGFDEVLSSSSDIRGTRIWEGSRTNVFAVRRDSLRTALTNGPLVPGIMRTLVIERARELSIDVVEDRVFRRIDLYTAEEIFLTNSVRGLIPVARVHERGHWIPKTWPAPGPVTQRLSLLVNDWLNPGDNPT